MLGTRPVSGLHRRRRAWRFTAGTAALLSALVLAPILSAQKELSLAGKVVDAAGAPVAGVRVASDWQWRADGLRSEHSAISAADGGFTLSAPSSAAGSVELLALDLAGGRGGFATWTEGAF
ncbi:MAG TPA: carboxypeptidase-like regulatory domain-containing protein, partial [Planctomycetota bacterium]|nr:carboxypeptidase-like regulatory domain-containing protein [Planctomycetota bacterium]